MLSATGEAGPRRVARRAICIDGIGCMAFCLTVFGWGLLWATGLSIIPLIPPWVGAAMFAGGLLLIPFRRRHGSVIGGRE